VVYKEQDSKVDSFKNKTLSKVFIKWREINVIIFEEGQISTLLLSTISGHVAKLFFPYFMSPIHWKVIRTARKTETTEILKSSTRFKNAGNYNPGDLSTWKFVKRLKNTGLLNACAHHNDGIERNATETKKLLTKKKATIIMSIFPKFSNYKNKSEAIREAVDTVAITEKILDSYFWAYELSVYCPNIKERIEENMDFSVDCVRTLKKVFPNRKCIGKISVVHPPIFAHHLKEAGADVIHSANTVPYSLIFGGNSPMDDVGGGSVSGGPAFETIFKFNEKVLEVYDGPIILGGGIVDDEKLGKYIDLITKKEDGYHPRNYRYRGYAFSLCTAAARRPLWTMKQIKKFNS
jgi:dihydroorotate dehydrogenase